MSKSLGNLYTLADLAKKGYSAMEVRYVLLNGHYRKPINFGFDSLHAGREALGLILPEAEKIIAPDEIKKLAVERWQARGNQDWAASDRLRDELLEKGWVVKDGREGYELVPA